MTNKDNGGPAFPFVMDSANGMQKYEGGMTLRDYFAANVRVTFQDAMNALEAMGIESPNGAQVCEMIAVMRWSMADAMLKERAK